MKKLAIISIMFLGLYGSFNSIAQNQMDHSYWDQLLLINVSSDGTLNYEGFKRDILLFDKYFNSIALTWPHLNAPKAEKIAYWVNIYNALVIKMVIDNYPVKSINDIKNAWTQKRITINDIPYSLDDIEHNILRKMKEPRIHFLLNCAVKSSPRLYNRAFTSENIMTLLKEKAKEYINDTNINLVSTEEAKISKVFLWYKSDFNKGNIVSFFNTYSDTKINPSSKISFVKYDWNLKD